MPLEGGLSHKGPRSMMLKAHVWNSSLMGTAWLLLFWHMVGTVQAQQQQQQQQQEQQVVEVYVSTGQELADAVAAWGASGFDTTIYMDVPYISMRNASFTNYSTIAARSAVQPFSQGVLTIRGQKTLDGQPTTVLDAGMRSGLLSVSKNARYHLVDLVLINLCEVQYPFSADGHVGPPCPFGVELFGLTSQYQGQFMTNVVFVGRQAALAFQNYGLIMESTAIPALRQVPTLFKGSTVTCRYGRFSEYVVSWQYMSWTFGQYNNITFQSLSDPTNDMLKQLRAQGQLMPPQFCNGTLLPTELVVADTDAEHAPLRVADDQPSFVRALNLTAADGAAQVHAQGYPPAVILADGSYTASGVSGTQVSSPMLLSSYRMASPDNNSTMLDLQQRTDVFNITPGGLIMLQWLALTGLAAQVPTQLPAGLNPDNLLPSVFPLAAFKSAQSPDTWQNSSSVVMSNTTLVIPPDDYLALLILASKQAGRDTLYCADAATIQRVAQLQAGFTNIRFSLPTPDAYQQPPLLVPELQGWGLNGSLLTIQPSKPVQSPVCASTSSTSGRVIGAAVGAAIGAIVILAFLTACIIYRCKGVRARHARDLSTPSKSTSSVEPGHGVVPAPPVSRSLQLLAALRIVRSMENPLFDRGIEQAESPQRAVQTFPLLQIVQQAEAIQQELLDSVAGMGSETSFKRLLSSIAGAGSEAGQRPELRASLSGWGSEPAKSGSCRTSADDQRQQLSHKLSPPERMLSLIEIREQVQQIADQLQHDGDKLVLAGVLGTGSSGTVFMGLWRGLHVAVKTVLFYEEASIESDSSASTSTTPHQTTSQKHAIMETAIAASMGHPNIVATYCFDVKGLVPEKTDKQNRGLQIEIAGSHQPERRTYKLFLVQELCHMSLAAACEKAMFHCQGTDVLDTEGVLTILLDIVKGLVYLHGKSIIHGDLKPENIMLKLDPAAPQGVIAKLTDFGLSMKLGPGATHVSNVSHGTPFYVAPEVLKSRRLSPASDMYSFGVLLWQMYNQQKPYLISAHGIPIQHPMFSRFPLNKPPPPEFVQLFNRCCDTNHQMRPTSKEAERLLTRLLIRAQEARAAEDGQMINISP